MLLNVQLALQYSFYHILIKLILFNRHFLCVPYSPAVGSRKLTLDDVLSKQLLSFNVLWSAHVTSRPFSTVSIIELYSSVSSWVVRPTPFRAKNCFCTIPSNFSTSLETKQIWEVCLYVRSLYRKSPPSVVARDWWLV